MNSNSNRAFVSQFLTLTLSLLLTTGSIGLGTVWLRHQISLAANANRVLQTRIAEVERHIDEVVADIAVANSVESLIRKNVQFNLGLVEPKGLQVVHLGGQPEQRLAAKVQADEFRFRDRESQTAGEKYKSGGPVIVRFRVASQ